MDSNKFFSTGFNYPKILLNDSTTDAVAGTGSVVTVTIDHNLGYIPSFRLWFDPDNNRRFPIGDALFDDFAVPIHVTNQVSAQGNVYATTTQIIIGYTNTFGEPTKDVTTYYRIYYDEQG